MEQLKQLLESANPYVSMMTEAQKLVKKWDASGLLDGDDLVKDKYGKEKMAMMLENQAKRLVIESSQTGTGASFTVGTGEQWAGVALPLVRKIFAEISSKEFVSVQPMSLPSGLVFYLEFKYGNQQPTIDSLTAGSRFNPGQSMYGTTNTKNADAFGGLYGAGKFGYSTNDLSVSNLTAVVTTASYADVNFNSFYSASASAGQLRKISFATASVAITKMDPDAVRSFVISASNGVNETNVFAEFTTYNSATDGLFFIVSGAAATSATASLSVYYTKITKDNDRGDFEDQSIRPLTGSAAIPEINVELRSDSVTAKTKKLKAKWTPEFSQDLNAYQSLDAEQELTAIISEYISAEIDLEILDMLIANANTTDVWSARNNTRIDPTGTTLVNDLAYYNTQQSWFQTLGTKIRKMSNRIHKKTLRGGANVLMCSPDVSTIFESIAGYMADSNVNDKWVYAMGAQKVGTYNSQFKVIKNPYMSENTILVAFKGSQYLECGAAFCPYVPLIMTPLLYDPETFTPRKGLMTRFAKKMLRPEFFGRIQVEGIDSI